MHLRNPWKFDLVRPAWYWLLLASQVALIWLLPYFPTQDGPSHLYNAVILRDLVQGGATYGRFFDAHLSAEPNLGFLAVVYPLLSVLTPFAAEKLFISLYVVLLGLAISWLTRLAGRALTPVAALLFPVLFNYPLLTGFYSYIIGIPLLLLTLCLYWQIRAKPFWVQLVIINLAGGLLYFCHLLIFIFFLIALALAAVLEAKDWRNLLARAALALCNVSIPLGIFLFYTWGARAELHSGQSLFSQFTPANLVKNATNLLTLPIYTFSHWQLLPGLLLSALIIYLAYGSLSLPQLKAWSEEAKGRFQLWLFLVAVGLMVFYLAAPAWIGALSEIKARIPPVLLLLLIPLLRLPTPSRVRQGVLFSMLALVFICLSSNVFYVWREARQVQRFLSGLELRETSAHFVATYKSRQVGWSRVDVLRHAVAYHCLVNHCVDAGNYEARSDYFFTRLKPETPPLPTIRELERRPETLEWAQYEAIRYLFCWDIGAPDQAIIGQHYEVIFERGQLSIWRRTGTFNAESTNAHRL